MLEITRDSFGRLILVVDAQMHEGIVPVRAFPLQTSDENIALVNTEGREVAWINRLSDVSEQARDLILEELAGREFIPEIRRIVSVSSFSTPSTWSVQTDRGDTSFVLRVEEDIRRLDQSLLVTDNHGIHFLIKNSVELDKHSRKILDRFL